MNSVAEFSANNFTRRFYICNSFTVSETDWVLVPTGEEYWYEFEDPDYVPAQVPNTNLHRARVPKTVPSLIGYLQTRMSGGTVYFTHDPDNDLATPATSLGDGQTGSFGPMHRHKPLYARVTAGSATMCWHVVVGTY